MIKERLDDCKGPINNPKQKLTNQKISLFSTKINMIPKQINPNNDILMILNAENLSSKYPPILAPIAAEILIRIAKYKISIWLNLKTDYINSGQELPMMSLKAFMQGSPTC